VVQKTQGVSYVRLYLRRIELFDDAEGVLDQQEELAEDMVLLLRSQAEIEVEQHILNKLIDQMQFHRSFFLFFFQNLHHFGHHILKALPNIAVLQILQTSLAQLLPDHQPLHHFL
jgi:hypothetical protein